MKENVRIDNETLEACFEKEEYNDWLVKFHSPKDIGRILEGFRQEENNKYIFKIEDLKKRKEELKEAYYEIKKKAVFDQYKKTIEWEGIVWSDFSGDEIQKIISDYVRLRICTCEDCENIRNKKKSKKKYLEAIENKKNKKKAWEVLKKVQDRNINYVRELFWKRRDLTEKVAPEIAKIYEELNFKKGKFYIVVSLPLGPFFEDKFEEKFQELRLGRKWKKCIDFDERGKGTLCEGIFVYDDNERELEKRCYDIKAFRGITYNEILTPIYKLDKKKLEKELSRDELKKALKTLESKEPFIKEVFGKINKILLEEKMDIKVRITKGGLVNILFEREFKENGNVTEFAEIKRKLMIDPYFDETLSDKAKRFANDKRLLKEEQIFSSYLNAAAIWITHIFLRECGEKLRKIFGMDNKDYLKAPWDVCNIRHSQENPDFMPEGSNIKLGLLPIEWVKMSHF